MAALGCRSLVLAYFRNVTENVAMGLVILKYPYNNSINLCMKTLAKQKGAHNFFHGSLKS